MSELGATAPLMTNAELLQICTVTQFQQVPIDTKILE